MDATDVQIFCDSCGAAIPAADVNLETLVARCHRCNSVFSVGSRLGSGLAPPPRHRPPLPSGLKVESGEPPLPSQPSYRAAPVSESGPLVITRRWFNAYHVFLILFCIFWDGFLVVWYTMAIRFGPRSGAEVAVPMLLCPSLHVAVGVMVSYTTLAGLVNRTVIRVTGGVLSIRHGPLPWRGNHDVPTDRLRQLYVRRKPRWRRSRTSWDLWADTTEHVAMRLLSGLSDRQQADYIEWALEEHLGIEDDPRYTETA